MSTPKPQIQVAWASAGATDPFPDTKVGQGWVAEIPEFDNFNWWMNRVDNFLQHTNVEGIPMWDADTAYDFTSYVKGSNGNIYRSRIAGVGTNQGNDPTATNSAFWRQFGEIDAVPASGGNFTGDVTIKDTPIITENAFYNITALNERKGPFTRVVKNGDSGLTTVIDNSKFSVGDVIEFDKIDPRGVGALQLNTGVIAIRALGDDNNVFIADGYRGTIRIKKTSSVNWTLLPY